MSVSQIGKRFGGNVAAMSGLAIHHDVIVQLGPDFPMAGFDFTKVDIQIRTGDDTCRMFLRRADIDEDKRFSVRDEPFSKPARNWATVSK